MQKQGRIAAIVLAGMLAMSAPSVAQQRTDETKAYAWEGPAQDGPKLLKEIAAARVALDVEGDLAKVQETLQALSLRASAAKAFEGQAEALVQAALARAELQLRLGDPEAAREELRHVQSSKLAIPGEVAFAEPSPALLRALATAQADPRLAKRLAELEAKPTSARTGGQESLQALVDEAFDNRDYGSIGEIGAPAFERFAELVLQHADDFPGGAGNDPLGSLLLLDERRAARLLGERLGAGSYLWKKRVLRAMTRAGVLTNGGTWTSTRPFVCLEPEWLELVERMLGERDTAKEALPFFTELERRDALTDSLNAAFRKALVAFGPDFATPAMQVFDHTGVVLSAQPALEAALELPDARLRRFAAEKLVNIERSEALLARASDPDPEVRRQVARALDAREVQIYQSAANPPLLRNLGGQIRGADTATVRTLLADADEGIRALSVKLLERMEERPGPEVYAALARDRSPKVRAKLVRLEQLAPAVRSSLLAELARDPSPQVIEELDLLFSRGCQDHSLEREPGIYLEALGIRWNDAQHALETDLRNELFNNLVFSAEGTRALVSWTLAAPTPEALARIAAGSRPDHLFALPDELLARLLASRNELVTWERIWNKLDQDKPFAAQRTAALRLLLANAEAPRRTRVAAARLLAGTGTDLREPLLKLLQHASWKTTPADEDERQRLYECARRLEPVTANALALVVLRDASLAPEVADAFVSGYRADATGGRELTQAILTRWFQPGAPARWSVNSALSALGSQPDLARGEWLERALVVPDYSTAVVDALEELADPAYLPLLRQAMRAEWMPVNDRDQLQRNVAGALASFDDDEAVELLLEGLRSSDTRLRNVCTDSLQRIQTYRDSVKSWRERSATAPTKPGALAELVTMLADADPLVRGQAALGLATLGASEAVPQLIRLLKDPDASVRAAAQKALDQLNAAAKPGGSG
jgi:HEAT repeat protein